MSLRENFVQTDSPEFSVPPILLQNLQVNERRIKNIEFVNKILAEHPREAVEDVSAVVHETNRIPDARVLIIDSNRILRLDGIPVDNSIEKTSYLGKLEYTAFEKIKEWANKNTNGAEIWFSGDFPGIYPVCKIDAGEIVFSSDQLTKTLLKKAILLDINSPTLLGLANGFADKLGLKRFNSVEELRSKPFFCTESELEDFFAIVSEYTDQIQQVENGSDLSIKLNTYKKLEELQNETHISSRVSHGNVYDYLRRRAEEERMIGDKSESCPTSQTAFQVFSKGAEITSGKILRCTCPNCKKMVNAVISGGRITCPECGSSAPYAC